MEQKTKEKIRWQCNVNTSVTNAALPREVNIIHNVRNRICWLFGKLYTGI